MASIMEICNLAISHIGGQSISNLDEASKEAIECKRSYTVSRNAVLRSHEWGFATKQITLALLTDEYLDYDYAYAYPIDALKIQKIYNPATKNKKLEYAVRASLTLASRVILTNNEDAQILYTAEITNTNLFDSLFLEAFSWRLAADLAQPVRGDEKLQQICMQTYLILINQAEADDSDEGYETPNQNNAYVEARN